MSSLEDLFWEASPEEIRRGYLYLPASSEYLCLICGKAYQQGVIYPHLELLLESERAVISHIEEMHGSMFQYLLGMNKKLTGLTELQQNLLDLFHKGYSDQEIARNLGAGSPSTIRSHRFSLKQKEKQAKIFLSIMGLLEKNKQENKKEFAGIHKRATVLDERFAITEEEREKMLNKYFKEGLDGPISDFPAKEKRKVILLSQLIQRFDPEKRYTEKEVNEVLKRAYSDYVTLRRYLIEYGYLDRLKDGSAYWVKQ